MQRNNIVIKFGGTSVANHDRWQNITTIIQNHLLDGHRPIVVCSAPNGITNLLEELLKQAISVKPEKILQEIESRFTQLATELQIDCQDFLTQKITELTQLAEGIRLIGEITPRVHARVLSYGELTLTHLGAEYLKKQNLNVHWQDAREWLNCLKPLDMRHPDAYLAARCADEVDENLKSTLTHLHADVVITQGFIARNELGETVLLGRGGSDSSAAYFAAKMNAACCEIWTDVPGIYTANPKNIPQARLISEVDYDEAQEIASMGATVLHPRCIAPVKMRNIPMYVKFTAQPERAGTKICSQNYNTNAHIKSILTKHNIIIITIETENMWQEVGFLAEVFQCFKRHGISIDLISTSQASVTVSLDSNGQLKQARVLDNLLHDLNQFAKAKIIAPCASVSVVGRNIRAILHQLGSVFSVFEEQRIHLLSQAANDLNLTFVVDEEQASRLAAKLHYLLLEQYQSGLNVQLTWQEEFGQVPVQTKMPWWQSRRKELLALAEKSSPLYVYSSECLKENVQRLKQCSAVDKIFYSMKANNNRQIIQNFYQWNLGFECVSLNEVEYILKLFPNIDRKRILFTPNFAPRNEYIKAIEYGVMLTLDSLFPLQNWADTFKEQSIFLRVDLGKGSGHHKYVVTGGDQSKFGIPLAAIEEVRQITQKFQINVMGLHSHAGSGILNPLHWQQVFESMTRLLNLFPNVKILDIGGGLGVVERLGQQALDLSTVQESLLKVKQNYPQLQLWMEPGRYLVSEAGVLLAKVTQTKYKGDLHFVGIETGMNSLIRPALYGAYHEIVNLTRLEQKKIQHVNIVGPICESADTLGYSRSLPECREGDVILIANAGAYGYSMSSHYNLRAPAAEYYLDLCEKAEACKIY